MIHLHSHIQGKNDSIQMLWASKNMSPKQKSYAFFKEVGNKLNKNKGLQY